ncbi:hypothetical protein AB205_0130040 [Aquarana catesbeiana]|uniref:Uncharacterized protein n=1 Tax=Aquarana catesbeiana TaxID=8400 RepID=A0A2G9R7H6_AQUCT|nr:hypothetical protein AB205_0130040 [Aquarana catesbeiana]
MATSMDVGNGYHFNSPSLTISRLVNCEQSTNLFHSTFKTTARLSRQNIKKKKYCSYNTLLVNQGSNNSPDHYVRLEEKKKISPFFCFKSGGMEVQEGILSIAQVYLSTLCQCSVSFCCDDLTVASCEYVKP